MKRIKKAMALCLAVGLITVFALTGCKSNSGDKLVVGLDDGFPPMGYRDDNGNLVGFDIDLAKEVAKRLNMEVEFKPINWTTNIQEVDAGNVDCLWNGMTVTPDREEALLLSSPYMKNNQVLVVKSDSDYQTKDDLNGKVLALQAGSSAYDAFNDEANADFKGTISMVLEYYNNVKALQYLDAGGWVVVLVDVVVANYYVTKLEGPYRVLDGSLAAEEYAIGFKKDNTELRDKVEKALKEMAADGTLAKISNEWFGHDVTVIQ